MSFTSEIRKLFPQLDVKVRDSRLVYLDSAATSLKPISVIEAVRKHMSFEIANVHRGAHFLSDRGTERFENVRTRVASFLGAEKTSEIIFTRGTTESVNLVASSLGRLILNPGDEIIVSQMDHHSNIVPWQMIAEQKQAKVRFVPVTENGSLDFSAFQTMLSTKTKIVSLVHLSNAMGTLNPLKEFFAAAKKFGAVCIVDGAQSVSVMPVDVKDLGCDFFAFSGHKIFAPSGIGVLYGKSEWLEKMPPYQGGGSMISEVREDGVSFLSAPHRFEAGTPAITEVIGLGAALEFIEQVGFKKIELHEKEIMAIAKDSLTRIEGLRQIGGGEEPRHSFSFLLGSNHPSDVGAVLDEQGIAVRAGHHCCQPLMRRFGIPGTVRASFSIYSSEEDVRDLVRGITKAKELLQ
jgi:cysteine desulfurase/selenocysteine lyase